MPRSITSTPTDMSPAAAARANIDPLVRLSRPRTTVGRADGQTDWADWLDFDHEPRAAAYRATSSGVRSVPTCPRMPETLIIRVSDFEPAGTDQELWSIEPSLWARMKASTTSGSKWTPAQRRSS